MKYKTEYQKGNQTITTFLTLAELKSVDSDCEIEELTVYIKVPLEIIYHFKTISVKGDRLDCVEGSLIENYETNISLYLKDSKIYKITSSKYSVCDVVEYCEAI